jgi:hypothetical protein
MANVRTVILALVLTALAAIGTADTYTVTSTGDSGAGTLRQAILDANAHPGADTIDFDIAGSGVHTISPASALPPITDAVTINGYSQPGSLVNTNPTSQGLNTVLRIEIDGTNVGSSPCLHVRADDITIRGLVVNRCTMYDIQAEDLGTTRQNFVVEGCFLATNADGTQALSPSNVAISIDGYQNARIGGTDPADRNLLSGLHGGTHIVLGNVTGTVVQGNLIGTDVTGLRKITTSPASVSIGSGTGNVIGGTSAAARNVMTDEISIGGSGVNVATGNFVQGNFIGTDVTGTTALHCHQRCVEIGDQNNTIGGSAPGAGNTIGGSNSVAGIVVQGGGTVIQGNFIGTDATGTARLPNKDAGIWVVNTLYSGNILIGGTQPGEGNLIAYNGGTLGSAQNGGIVVESQAGHAAPSGVTIRGNSIFDNSGSTSTNGLGIDLLTNSTPGVTFNDTGDGDTGPNGFQNYPIIESITYGGSTTTVTGTLNSASSSTFDLDFYGSPVCSPRPQDLPEGKTYLGSIPVTTNASGDATFNAVLPVALPNGSTITATATDAGGNTSEFSPRFVISLTPPSGPGTVPGAATIKGLAFEDGATVTVGGIPALNVTLVDGNTLSLVVPVLPPGTINDVFVQNPGGGLSGTLPKGRIADFLDVPSSNTFYSFVTKLVGSGITAGIGGGNYGVNQPTLREQMAVFLLKSKYGLCFTPPPCAGVFDDVPCPSLFADWIEELAAEQITAGCDTGKFCPEQPVQRDQMAVFLLKTEHGHDYLPPDCTGVFADVECPSLFANWIEQLYTEQVTGGCLTNPLRYCPENANTRGEMAVFLVKDFALP